jgi:hypothetical protein
MEPLIFCQILAAWTIVGAVESQPGWIKVDYLDHNQQADFIIMPMKDYKVCYPDELE